jgi:hypothetical protein
MSWYQKIVADPDNLEPLVGAMEYFEEQYQDGLNDMNVSGKRLWDMSKKLPGLMAYRYGQYKELEAIGHFLDLKIRKHTKSAMEDIMTHYNRAMSERTAEKWAEADEVVVTFKMLKIEVDLLMRKFEGLTKGIEQMHFQMSNLVKMRDAGIEDALF